MNIQVEVSVGELLDKISILEIKNERISDSGKRINVLKELHGLLQVRENQVPLSSAAQELYLKLKETNENLWKIEDEIRDCEIVKDFGPKFIQLARSVYKENDLRCSIKRQLNEMLGSELVEEKSYAEYSFNV